MIQIKKPLEVPEKLVNSSNVDNKTKNEFEELLNEYTQDSAEFASMIRCAIRDNFRF